MNCESVITNPQVQLQISDHHNMGVQFELQISDRIDKSNRPWGYHISYFSYYYVKNVAKTINLGNVQIHPICQIVVCEDQGFAVCLGATIIRCETWEQAIKAAAKLLK